jgi:hypothetical protein
MYCHSVERYLVLSQCREISCIVTASRDILYCHSVERYLVLSQCREISCTVTVSRDILNCHSVERYLVLPQCREISCTVTVSRDILYCHSVERYLVLPQCREISCIATVCPGQHGGLKTAPTLHKGTKCANFTKFVVRRMNIPFTIFEGLNAYRRGTERPVSQTSVSQDLDVILHVFPQLGERRSLRRVASNVFVLKQKSQKL